MNVTLYRMRVTLYRNKSFQVPMTHKLNPIRLSLVTLTCISGLTHAQQESDSESESDSLPDNAIEQMIVTGGKRDTLYIQSDISVTVLDAEAIDDARLRDFVRIDDLVPNVQFNEQGQRGSIFVTVRGVESNPFIVNRAAVYIDGIPFRELSNSVLSQVDSIEVLRGPQGTLYGANTESGLILVNTKAPGQEIEGEFRLTHKNYSSGSGKELDGFFAGGLVEDILSGSVSMSYAKEDAYVENLGTSTGETGRYTEQFVQGKLVYTPSDNLTINSTAYWLDLDAPGVFSQQYLPLDLDLYNQIYADFNGGQTASKWDYYQDAPKYFTVEEVVVGLSATYDTELGSWDFAVSHREIDQDSKGLDFDLTATPVVSGREFITEDFSNVEVRFTSPENGLFDYILGVAYYRSQKDNTKASFIGSGGLDDYLSAPVQTEEAEDSAIFASTNWYLTERLRLSAGLRYERAKRSTLQREGELDLGFGSVVFYPDANLSKTFNQVLPRLAAHYEISSNFSVYASSAEGYIPGGFNLVAVQQGFDDQDLINYDSETLLSSEMGFKWQSNDLKTHVSGAAFYITSDNWQEIQIATDDTGRPVSTDFTGSDASIRSAGVELELGWEVSDYLDVDAHLGIVDAEYTDLQLEEDLNVRGQDIQFVPEYDAGVSLRYGGDSGIFVRGEVGFTGKTALRARGDIIQKAVETYGIQIGYETSNYIFRLFGENLTDERIASGLAIENLAFGTDGLYYAPLDSPRVIGIELEMRL